MKTRVVNVNLGITLREGDPWILALCDGDANTPIAECARANYKIVEVEE